MVCLTLTDHFVHIFYPLNFEYFPIALYRTFFSRRSIQSRNGHDHRAPLKQRNSRFNTDHEIKSGLTNIFFLHWLFTYMLDKKQIIWFSESLLLLNQVHLICWFVKSQRNSKTEDIKYFIYFESIQGRLSKDSYTK